MANKQTCEELEQRVKELEKESVERKRTEEALRESEGKYPSLVKNIPDVAWTTDSEGSTIPLIEARIEKPTKTTIEPLKGIGTILVIEDEEIVMEMTTAVLEMLGYRVLGAKTGKEAISMAKTFDGGIDLAILDIVLPDMHGKSIYPRLMEARPNLKVLVFSGNSINGPAQEILNAGAQDFIQKPFTIAGISEKLKKILEVRTSPA